MGVRLWRSERSFEDSHSHGSDCLSLANYSGDRFWGSLRRESEAGGGEAISPADHATVMNSNSEGFLDLPNSPQSTQTESFRGITQQSVFDTGLDSEVAIERSSDSRPGVVVSSELIR
jgi:hypothetical protein